MDKILCRNRKKGRGMATEVCTSEVVNFKCSPIGSFACEMPRFIAFMSVAPFHWFRSTIPPTMYTPAGFTAVNKLGESAVK
jgi:hypothetical protein